LVEEKGVVNLLSKAENRRERVRISVPSESFANNLEQVANLLCAQANSASYLGGTGNETGYGLSGADFGNAPPIELFARVSNGCPHNAQR